MANQNVFEESMFNLIVLDCSYDENQVDVIFPISLCFVRKLERSDMAMYRNYKWSSLCPSDLA